MKAVEKFVVTIVLSVVSFGSFAQSVSATALTLNDAQAKIAAQAKRMGASSYKIIEAHVNNGVHVTARLIK